MGNRIKRFMLCLIAVSMIVGGGNIYAGSEENIKAPDAAEEQPESGSSPAALPENEVSHEGNEELKQYLEFAGSSEDMELYLRGKNSEEKVWAAHGFRGGKPKKKADLNDAQKKEYDLASKEVTRLKKLDGAAYYTKNGETAAELRELSGEEGGKRYISRAGRYIVSADKNGRLARLYTAVSLADSRNAFTTDGGRTLALMSSDNKRTDTEYTYKGTEDGKKLYVSGESFAWLSEGGGHYYGTYRYCAENDSFRMLVDDRTSIMGIENKETGYIWWSSPIDASQGSEASDLLLAELRSSGLFNYGNLDNRSNNNTLRSGNSGDCTVTVSDIEGGVRVTYDYKKAGFSFPVDYTLGEDCLRAYLCTSEIEEKDPRHTATEVTLLGSFGAASSDEEGYFVIPDGSGALIRFNNGKGSNAAGYSQRVYGRDVTAVPETMGAAAEQIYLPVYGIVKEDNAMLVVAAQGDANALLTAKTPLQSNNGYNTCNFRFTLRNTDTYRMAGSNEALTVFERGSIGSGDIELRYYPISGKGVGYTDIAARYRRYLEEEAGVRNRTKEKSAPLYVDLLGGVMKKRSVIGIPVNMKTAVTDFDEAEDILETLRNSGVDDMVISYANWTGDGIKNKVDTKAKPAFVLGGKSDFRSLMDYVDENGFELYPVSDNRDFRSGNGYYAFAGSAVRVSGSYSRILSYDRAYGVPDSSKENKSLLSPKYYGKVFGKVSKNYDKAGIDGLCAADLTTSLYGDYGKKHITRADSMQELIECYAQVDDRLGNGLLAENANAYALPYVNRIKDVPLNSSRFDIFDEDIPFYQLVMHGLIPYAVSAVNGSPDPETMLLMAAATGSGITYDMMDAEPGDIMDTEFDIYYYADCVNWTDTAAAEYELLRPVLADVSTSTITGYERSGDKITAEYSNGTVVKVDLGKKTIDFNGRVTNVEDFAKERGIRF